MSKPALWMTSLASPMKARNSSASRRTAACRQELVATGHGREGLARHVALGIEVDVVGLAGRDVVDQLDAADLDQPVALVGSRPVVSVSRTISRIASTRDARGSAERGCRRQVPARGRPLASAPRRCPRPVSMTKSARRALFASGIWRARMAVEASPRHARPGQHALALHCGRRRDHDDGVAAPLAAGLEQQRDVEHHQPRAAAGAGEEAPSRARGPAVDDRLEPRSAADRRATRAASVARSIDAVDRDCRERPPRPAAPPPRDRARAPRRRHRRRARRGRRTSRRSSTCPCRSSR